MRGLMANPKGEIIERPIKANFMEGLTVLEYFISTHGARKGLADTALRTADSGYLTRRLVDVAQDVIIRERRLRHRGVHRARRCSTRPATPNDNLLGRFAAGGRSRPSAARQSSRRATRSTAPSSPTSSRPSTRELDDDGAVRSPSARCSSARPTTGVCQACYGRSMATGKTAQIGDAVGIIAAQSIGEPGTQLTMRTFHTGGVAGADITHGLPRVVELFEARKPKGLAKIAEQSTAGRPSRRPTRRSRSSSPTTPARSTATRSRAARACSSRTARRVEAGTQLNEGSLYPHELLAIRGRTETELYLVKEVQEVYKSQGVDINDKHIELIVRQMMKKVRVDQKGDTDYLPGAVRRPLRVRARSTTRSRPRAARRRSSRRSSSASPRPR